MDIRQARERVLSKSRLFNFWQHYTCTVGLLMYLSNGAEMCLKTVHVYKTLLANLVTYRKKLHVKLYTMVFITFTETM